MAKHFGYFATWVPSYPLRIGDYGILRGNRFFHQGNLSQFGLSFAERQANSSAQLDYSSAVGVSISFKAAGAIPAAGSFLTEGDAGIQVTFSSQGAVVFQALDCTVSAVDDTASLGTSIKKLFTEGKWDKQWAVVTELLAAASATVLVSLSANANIDLKATGNVGTPVIRLADVDAQLAVAYSKNLNTELIAQKDLKPLFQLYGLHVNWWRSTPDWEPQHLGTEGLLASRVDQLTPDVAKTLQDSDVSFERVSPVRFG